MMAAQDTQDTRDDGELSSSTVDAKLDRYKDTNKPTKSSSSKSKDLSHVPCKFFKVGSCTAGSSCPFSHQVQQPGQQKDVCAWFVKGNCKFGHKCALAHILPGQSPAMDRRNKKAAQLAAAAASSSSSNNNGGAQQRERERESRNRKAAVAGESSAGQCAAGGNAGGGRTGPPSRSNTLLSGSTAPTRMLPTGARPPLPISISKAAPAPAETAPTLRDADFTSRDAVPRSDEQNGAGAADTLRTHGEGDMSQDNIGNPTNGVGVAAGVGVSSPPNPVNTSPFPVSTPPRPHRFAGRHGSSPSIDFGPVGSPPRASPSMNNNTNNSNPIRINGFSPGTSPRDPVQITQPLAAAGTSTFGAPGANLFINPSNPRGAAAAGSGLAASLSLGTTQGPTPQPFTVGSLPVLSRPVPPDSQSYAEALDDEDMEDFVPCSLKDLLTPEEQSRRMSRTSSSHIGTGAGGTAGEIPTSVARSAVQREDSRHRHSRSVPSTSLLSQNLRSIWSDNGGELGNDNPGLGLSPSAGGGLGASPSFASSPGLHAFDKDGPSPSMLNPSNASAAFLGLHQYMGPSRVPGGTGGVRAVSQGNIHYHTGLATANAAAVNPSASSSFDAHALNNRIQSQAMSSSPSHLARPPFDAFSSSSPSKYTLSPRRPVPAAQPSTVFRPPEQALSPASRALQAHVPGQSLPQGLAAGFSRIHLQPTTTGAAFSPGNEVAGLNGSGVEWMSVTPTNQHQQPTLSLTGASNGAGVPEQLGSTTASGTEPDASGLMSMFSHLSYSSVTAGSLRGHGYGASSAVPTSMSRRSSARGPAGWGGSHPLSSPLSGPVLTNDDDDLFSMDEEK